VPVSSARNRATNEDGKLRNAAVLGVGRLVSRSNPRPSPVFSATDAKREDFRRLTD
jgi:hypothetical protein